MMLIVGCGGTQETVDGPVGVSRASADVHREAPVERQRPIVVLLPEGREPVTVKVEVAANDPARERGLMYRRHLAEDAGMLFVFDRMEHQSFWMENTYIPLDMIFIDDALRVVGVVENAEPLTEDAREVEGESRYVLEVNAGFARQHDILPGTQVRFENFEEVDDAQQD